jgi:hypothetical protein
MAITLPEPLQTYFAPANQLDHERIAGCFHPDATVRDEGRSYHGLAAIKAWKADSRARYEYTVEPLSLSHQDEGLCVIAHVVGNFPGSPVDLAHQFRLSNGRITALEIHG